MLAWCERQITIALHEKTLEDDNLTIARQKHWSTLPFARRVRQLEKRIEFLQKIHTAVEAGFVIIPNFNLDLFAIRTDRAVPASQGTSSNWPARRTLTESSKRLPAGEGEYVNPDVETTRTSEKEGDRTTHYFETIGEFSDITYPIAIAKPELMTRAAQAMALKVFDQIGVANDTIRAGGAWRRGDPILVGRILNSNRNKAPVSFFLGWYFDPSILL